MVKKIIGIILIIIGGLQLIMRMVNANPNMPSHGGGGPANHLGPLAGIFTTIGPLVVVIPIVFVIVGLILFTHKEKVVKNNNK